MQDIKVTTLTKKLLKHALAHNLYWNSNTTHVPFSKSKAQWLLQNERIEDDDICAILGYEKDELISFVYMVPDWIKTETGMQKIYWSSRWWVHDKYKNSVLSSYTKNLSVTAVKNHVIIKHLGIDTLTYYDKQPFATFSERTRYIFVFNLDYNLIISKFKVLKHISSILKTITSFSHYTLAKINKSKTKKATKDISYEYLSTLNETAWEFVKKHCENDLIPKSKSYINWQIDNNQYTIAEVDTKAPYKCLISSISHKIYNITFLVIKENATIGFVSALVRGDEFVVRYFLSDKIHFDYCINALMDNFIKTKCSFILTENELLGYQIKQRYLSVYTNKRQLISLAHNDIDFNFKTINISEQDGHFA